MCVCVACASVSPREIYDYRDDNGSKSYRRIITVMIIMIAITLPVYCNIIDALVEVTFSFFTNNFDEIIYKTVSKVMTFLKSMKTTAMMIKIVF